MYQQYENAYLTENSDSVMYLHGNGDVEHAVVGIDMEELGHIDQDTSYTRTLVQTGNKRW